MAGRGSGIGLSFQGGLGVGNGTGGPSTTSTRPAAPGQLYGKKVSQTMGNLAVHHWLWMLVAIEVGLLVLLRTVVFGPYHGG